MQRAHERLLQRLRLADRQRPRVEAASSILKLDSEQFIVTFVHDVSERLRQESQAAALAQGAASVSISDSVNGTVQALAECVLQGTRALGAWVSLYEEEDLGTWIGLAGLPDGAREGIRRADRTTASYARFTQDLKAHRVVAFPEARHQAESNPRTARLAQALKLLPWRAAALAPRSSRGRVIGLLNAIYREDQLPTAAETTFIATLAEHAAIAGANARLVAAAERRISIGERRRLARELHDSVSQDLFGIELGANRPRELLENDPARAVRPDRIHPRAGTPWRSRSRTTASASTPRWPFMDTWV